MSILSARPTARRITSFAARFATVDVRSLALLRVVLGGLLIADLCNRWRFVDVLYSNDGVLSNHFSLFRPLAPFQFSFYVGASSAREVTVAFGATVVIYLLFAVGYRTRIFHVLSLVCVTSLHARNLMTELPSDVPLHLWLAWSLFLPLGARFSVDALRRPASPELSAVTSIAVAGLVLQISVMHFFAAMRQVGPAWQDGTALYYALRQNLWVTDFGEWVGRHVGTGDLRSLSHAYRALEILIALLVLVPAIIARRAAIALLVGFHLGSRLLWNFGAYEWVMLGATPVLLSTRDWDTARAWVRGWMPTVFDRPNLGRVEDPSPAPFAFDDSARRWFARMSVRARESAALMLMLVCAIALAGDMGDEVSPSGIETVAYRAVAYPRLFQRWGLFAPEPSRRSGTLVAEAETASGTRLDPLTGAPRVASSEAASPRPDPLMAAYFENIGRPDRSTYVNELREYVRRFGDRRGSAEKLVWFNVDWIEAPVVEPEGTPSSPAEVAIGPVSRRITSGP